MDINNKISDYRIKIGEAEVSLKLNEKFMKIGKDKMQKAGILQFIELENQKIR